MDYKKQGKKNRKKGSEFELSVRKQLEKDGWIVIKNTNNVIDGQFKQAKPKFNPFTKRIMMNGQGFPDFIAYRTMELTPIDEHHYEIIGVESKINGRLDREERDKSKWLIENNILSRILIASKNEDSINKIKFEDLK